jgi:hypothetical protein
MNICRDSSLVRDKLCFCKIIQNKKIFYVTVALIILAVTGNCQIYKPFNFDKGIWYCKYVTKGGLFGVYHGPVYVTDSVKYFCNGDTTINNVLFKKLYHEGYSSSEFIPNTYFYGYSGAVRNDTLNKKVYFIPHGYDSSYKGTGFLWYNFDVKISDSIGISCYYANEIIKVTSIDSVSYCNQYFRYLKTSTGDDIIEGIGSVYGLSPLNCPLACGWLICYQEQGNDDCADCNLFTSIPKNYHQSIKIYPNPTNGKIQITPNNNIQLVEIFDLHGNLIETITYDFEDITLKNEGIYILRIKSDDKISIYKVVKN